MKRNEFSDALSEFLDESVCEQVLGNEAIIAKLPEAPLDNFFGDDLLTLLYLHTGSCSPALRKAKDNLEVVCDKGQPRHVRAEAAVALGRFVLLRHPEASPFSRGASLPIAWFRLARELGSVIGALGFANMILKEAGQYVEFNLERDPLPRLAWIARLSTAGAPAVSAKAAQAWGVGARVALRHVQRGFTGWESEAFCCALACVVNYLTILPEQRLAMPVQVPLRRQALDWIRPLWNRLIKVAPEHALEPEAYRAALIEQQLAVFVRLDGIERGEPLPEERGVAETDAGEGEGEGEERVTLITGVIPPSSERSEKDVLMSFEILRKPIALSPLPDMVRLGEIRDTLEAEFPWAFEPIAVIMRDLIGRKRHGVARLGLAPVLLVGPPGTGKTRLAQRLSDLLGTPNTVINLAGMSDVKVLKGVTRGWASNRPSKMVEFICQNRIANPLFVLDEIDKAGRGYGNGGDPQEALLDLLEPGNARRYHDVYLMTECDLSHCLYVATSNSLARLPAPLLSRLRPVFFPRPGPEHTEVIARGILGDMAHAWGLPEGVLTVAPDQIARLRGMAPREMRRALLAFFGSDEDARRFTLH